MSDNLFVIHCNEDGESGLEVMTKTEFLKGLKEEWWGKDSEIADPLSNKLPAMDIFVGLIVIEGTMVKPHPKEAVTEYTF